MDPNQPFLRKISVIVDPGPVLTSPVIALLINGSGVDDPKIVGQELFQGQDLTIEGDLDRLRVVNPRVLAVGCSRLDPVGISHFRIKNAGYPLKIPLHSPEAASGQVEDPGSRFLTLSHQSHIYSPHQ